MDESPGKGLLRSAVDVMKGDSRVELQHQKAHVDVRTLQSKMNDAADSPVKGALNSSKMDDFEAV